MKTLKLPNNLVQEIIDGDRRQLLIVNEDLMVNDKVQLLNIQNQVVGQLEINEILIKRLKDFDDQTQLVSTEQTTNPGNSDQPASQIQFSFTTTVQNPVVEDTDVTNTTKVTEVKLYTDGGSRGNPGPAASGWVLYDLSDKKLLENGFFLGTATNNLAEYTALKMGLEDALKLGARDIEIYMDSLLIVNQMKGLYKVKSPELKPTHDQVKALLPKFNKFSFTHVPRALNKEADRMVNQTLDQALGLN